MNASPSQLDGPAAIRCDVDSSTDDYARRFEGAVGRWMLDVQARAMLELIGPWPGATVLDVGGGHAQLAGPLLDAGHPVTVLGSEPSCGDRPRRLVGDRAAFVVGDILDPPFPDRSFDVVVSVRMMAHVADWPRFVHGLCRVARRAVIVDFATPWSVNAIAPLLFRLKKRIERNTRPFNLQRRRAVEHAFEAEGFGDFAAIGQYVAPMALHRAMKSPGLSRAIEAVLGGVGLSRLFGSPMLLRATRIR